MSTDKWEVHRVPHNVTAAVDIADQRRHILQVRDWLREWAETGSNPFVHERLYRARFPRCAQDAFMATTTYVYKTAASEQTVFQIIEERAASLVAEYSETTNRADGSKVDTTFPKTDVLESLGRVQALLVYQVICLFDGDIRLRHHAERRIPILYCWMGQLLRQARETPCLGSWMVFDSPHHRLYAPGARISLSQLQNLLWHSWIMAESVRRTWLLCSSVQGIYELTRDGPDASPCQGGITITTRQGIWAARTAAEWGSLCARESVRMVKMKEADRLFEEVMPEEVDEFTKVVMEVVYGTQRMETWRSRVPAGAV